MEEKLKQAASTEAAGGAKSLAVGGGSGSGSGESIRVVIIGGSIAGLACAHALLKTGVCKVMVLEKARRLTAGGAGLAIDQPSCNAFEDWGLRDQLFLASKPMDREENRAISTADKVFVKLTQDENFRHWATHWSDLHRILHDALPPGIAHFGHEVTGIARDDDGSAIKVSVEATEGGFEGEPVPKEVLGDLIVAADGSMSRARQMNWPNETRRYAGYCAWRGVVDCSDEPQLYESVKAAYPRIGETIYFELASGTHAVLYELSGRRLNWLWYVNQPEPALKGDSVTQRPDEKAIAEMRDNAAVTWMPGLADLIRMTPAPFINAIYDRNPVKQFAWKRVALVGEAAHPTTPHALRSTNMSIADAFALGKAIGRFGPTNINSALMEYETQRVGTSAQQVLFSRHLGQLKQGMLFEPEGAFHWGVAHDDVVNGLMIRNMNSFEGRP